MSAPHGVHLLCAGEALAHGYRHGGYLALCGEPIAASDLPAAGCHDDCDCEVTYCLGCLDAATKRNERWAVHPGSPLVIGSRPGI